MFSESMKANRRYSHVLYNSIQLTNDEKKEYSSGVREKSETRKGASRFMTISAYHSPISVSGEDQFLLILVSKLSPQL
jgi:hypothetical protein